MPPSMVHFNGSVNLPDAETVMREVTTRVPVGVRRIPDGETGDRRNWIFFQLLKFIQSPSFVLAPAGGPAGSYRNMPQVRLAGSIRPEDVEWPDPGYAEAYRASYLTFGRLRKEGVISPDVRFQVEYPTPLACMSWMVADQEALHGSYERVLFADLARFLAAVPLDDIAVQWDVAVEFAVLEASTPEARSQALQGITASLTRCVEQVPGEVQVGLHLCYGDYGHQHFKEPDSLDLQVRLLDTVSATAQRPVSFASLTVPQYQRDPAYFAPLSAFQTGPETELYLALVPYHPAEQEPGTTADQIAVIDATLTRSPAGSRQWGVCTECGMGRVSRDEIPGLLDLHREIISSR